MYVAYDCPGRHEALAGVGTVLAHNLRRWIGVVPALGGRISCFVVMTMGAIAQYRAIERNWVGRWVDVVSSIHFLGGIVWNCFNFARPITYCLVLFCSVLYIVCTVNVYIYENWKKSLKKKNMQVPQHEVLTRTKWILASTGDAGPTFNRHWVGVGL